MTSTSVDAFSFEDSSIEIPTKPGVLLHYTYNKAPTSGPGSQFLLVCLNGLLVPQSGWFPCLFEFLQHSNVNKPNRPSILTYDRWAQGRTTDHDPVDSSPGRNPEYGHDMMDVVQDLHQLLLVITTQHHKGILPPLVFLANSIGCAIARLYAMTFPSTAAAFIFLDSIMAHTDFVSLWPDPDAPDFDATTALPLNVPVEALRRVRESYKKIFHPTVVNPEHLDRRTLRQLLPSPSEPPLPVFHATNRRPLLVVVGHDPETFAKEGEEKMGTPVALTLRYSHARWHEYNEALLKLTDEESARGPVIAKGCAHFVQRDGPVFVAEIVAEVFGALVEGRPLRRWNI